MLSRDYGLTFQFRFEAIALLQNFRKLTALKRVFIKSEV